MIWIILFFIIILISSVLAYRSMRDYEEFPDSTALNSLFYIAAPLNLTEEVLMKLYNLNLAAKRFFSLEKLIKGKEKAWVIFGNRDLIREFPELNLVELEDYISESGDTFSADSEQKVNVNQSLSWLIEPKNNSRKLLQVTDELKHLVVEDGQKIFMQVVLMPTEKPEGTFQATLRVMAADSDPIKRVELAKAVEKLVNTATGLNKREDNFPEIRRFESFKQRTLIPKEVAEFNLSTNEVLSLLK